MLQLANKKIKIQNSKSKTQNSKLTAQNLSLLLNQSNHAISYSSPWNYFTCFINHVGKA